MGRPRPKSSAQGQRSRRGARGEERVAVSGNPEGGGLLPRVGPCGRVFQVRLEPCCVLKVGPMARFPFTSFPTAVQPFRALLLRLCARNCRVAVHSTLVDTTVELVAGVLVRRSFVWKTRVCPEASQSLVECASAGQGFGSSGRAGQPLTGDCGGRPAVVPRSEACN